eukprot:309410-Chlamydomonas_euryale.AAC.7
MAGAVPLLTACPAATAASAWPRVRGQGPGEARLCSSVGGSGRVVPGQLPPVFAVSASGERRREVRRKPRTARLEALLLRGGPQRARLIDRSPP